MSKKMKRVALESSPYVVFEENNARLKHQTLLQDYLELHKFLAPKTQIPIADEVIRSS